MAYQFTTQLKQGQQAEQELDQYFSRFYRITPATPEQQRQGIDRIFQYKEQQPFGIEYKCDAKSERTGNIFIETISVQREGEGATEILGWAYTSRSQWIFIYQPVSSCIFVLETAKLRRCMRAWEGTWPSRVIPNRDYLTHGLLVPVKHLTASDACRGVIITGKNDYDL